MDIPSMGPGPQLAPALPAGSEAPRHGTARPARNDAEAELPAEHELADALAHIQDFIHSINRNLQFKLDEGSGRMVVQVYAGDTGEMIRQIPGEEVLRLAEQLEDAGSLLFNAQA